MEIVNFDTIDSMVSTIDDYVQKQKSDYMAVDIVAHYEYITHLLESLIRAGYVITNVRLTDQACSGYDKEYLLEICGTEMSVEPLWHDDAHNSYYAETWSDIAFIHKDCNAALLKAVKAGVMYDFSIV